MIAWLKPVRHEQKLQILAQLASILAEEFALSLQNVQV